MIQQEIIMTPENEKIKKFLLDHYNTDSISVAYGRFNTPTGYFVFGKRNDGKYAYFQNHNAVNQCIVLDNLDDENKISECLELIGLFRNTKQEKMAETLFDFL